MQLTRDAQSDFSANVRSYTLVLIHIQTSGGKAFEQRHLIFSQKNSHSPVRRDQARKQGGKLRSGDHDPQDPLTRTEWEMMETRIATSDAKACAVSCWKYLVKA